jgi:hypothetical protein
MEAEGGNVMVSVRKMNMIIINTTGCYGHHQRGGFADGAVEEQQ